MNKKNTIKLIFAIYIIFIFIVTQLPIRKPFPIDYINLIKAILSLRVFENVMYNLVPFGNIDVLIETLHYSRNFSHTLTITIDYFKGFIYNIILFIPLGVLLPALKSKYQQLSIVLMFSLVLSVGIELLQLVQQLFSLTSWRVVDIEDVIANVIGATLGFLVYSAYQQKVYRARILKNQQRDRTGDGLK